MPSLAEIKTEGNFKGLLLGAPGSGKTVFAASFPTPMLYLDFDNKIDSAALFYKNDVERLKAIDVRQLIRSNNPAALTPYQQMEKIMKEELIPQEATGQMNFKTLVIDSISAFSTATLDQILKSNPGIAGVMTAQGKMPAQPHYGVLLREFTKLIPALLDLPNVNVVMCAHIETYKDPNTGMIIRAPMMDGSFSEKLPQYFKEVWHTYVDDKGKFMAQTKADTKFSCLRSQIKGLPNPLNIENGYKELEKYL